MARPIWRGSISFGLVNIPIGIYAAIQEHTLSFHLLTPDGKCRLRRKLVCPETGKEYSQGEAMRGLEVAPDKYVVVDPDELAKLQPKSADIIELERFVDIKEIDPIYFNRTYYVHPEKGAEKAYYLLHRALHETNKAGIGEFIMRTKEYLGCVRTNRNMLLLDTLLFENEIRKDELDKKPSIDLGNKELNLAKQLIESLSDKFDPSQYSEDYKDEVQKLINRKKKGAKKIESEEPKSERRSGKVIDLMKKLEESLKTKSTSGKRSKSGTGPKKKKSA